MKTRIQPKWENTPTDGHYFYQKVSAGGSLWTLGFHNSDTGEERFLLPCFFVRKNNRGWTMVLATPIATNTVRSFLSRGEWEQVEIDD